MLSSCKTAYPREQPINGMLDKLFSQLTCYKPYFELIKLKLFKNKLKI